MKKIFYTIFSFFFISSALYAQKGDNPLSYPYYIMGTTQIDPENGSVILSNISYKGFSCKEDLYKVGVESDEKAEFRFDEIMTYPYIPLAGRKLQYWRQDEYGAWMTDEEGGNGIANASLEKDMTIMLVLDCSKSLGDDFIKVKRGAISFIDKLYKASGKGYVRLGIIGFSSISEANRQRYEIKPLTAETYQSAVNFINALVPASNTALYYAISSAVDMLDEYVESNFSTLDSERYNGTYMLAFTDGIDNASQFREQKIYTSKQAYDYTKSKIINTTIKGSPIESYIIGARGVDLKTTEQTSKFQMELKGLIPDGYQGDRFTYLENMQNLEKTFENIADGLAKRWQNLYCYTSLAHEGGVCWTLGEPEYAPVYVAPKPEPVNNRNIFFGVNVGIGIGSSLESETGNGFMYSIGIDFAYPVSKMFGIGLYAAYKGLVCKEKGEAFIASGFDAGVMMTAGNYHSGRIAFVGGVGIEYNEFSELMADIRAGVRFGNGIYLMGEAAVGGDGYSEYEQSSYVPFNVGIRIGFDLGRLFNKRNIK